jgi:hypothetical protein
MDRKYKDQLKEKWTDNTKTNQRKNGQIIQRPAKGKMDR